MNVAQIISPLPGEHLAATSPKMLPEMEADWRQRLNFWAGRALTAEALELDQEHRAAHLAWQGRIPTAGIVTGLEVAVEEPFAPAGPLATAGHFLHLLPGHGLTVYGEDVTIPRPLRIALDRIPIYSVRFRAPDDAAPDATPLEFGGVSLDVEEFGARHVPWAAVLVARPAEFGAFGKVDPEDPCELDPSRDAFADERRLDATVLRLFQLPPTMENDPRLADRDSPRWRNLLANTVLAAERDGAERQFMRFLASRPAGDRWDTVLAEGAVFPWELFGVPLALLSSELDAAGNRRFFLDRASVARPGGRSRPRSRSAAILATEDALRPPGAGTPALWRARVDQFAEHLGSLDGMTLAEQAARFQFVPPVGILPTTALDFLTTQEAIVLPPSTPGQPPDRAASSRFFPRQFDVEAVPIPTEDLDAALAASAPLASFDFDVIEPDDVRVLVPLPQRVFDPRLLVVELEDPFFAAEVARLIAVRQDWRQRRDFVLAKGDRLDAIVNGPPPVVPALERVPAPALESGQIEIEPVENAKLLGFSALYLSPPDTAGPREMSATFPAGSEIELTSGTVLFVRLRLDLEHPPSAIEVRWQAGATTLAHLWTSPSDAQAERFNADGTPRALDLWRLYTVTGSELGVSGGKLTGFTLRLEDGRAGLIDAGILEKDERHARWEAQLPKNVVTFSGGEWTLSPEDLTAPFEDDFQPVFTDGRDLDKHLQELNLALNPASATPRATPLLLVTVGSIPANIGLTRAITELEAEAGEADDFIDAHFLRAQTNLYRVRKLILGQSAAQRLLVNPALATIVEQETASATAEQLSTYLTAAKGRAVKLSEVNKTLTETLKRGTRGPRAGGLSGVALFKPNPTVTKIDTGPSLLGAVAFKPEFSTGKENVFLDAGAIGLKPGFSTGKENIILDREIISLDPKRLPDKNVIGQLPETGPTLPPHGLSIGQRFVEPAATSNLSFARAALNDLLSHLPRLRLPLVGAKVRALNGAQISLLELQGRAAKVGADEPDALRTKAINALMEAPKLNEAGEATTDEAEVTLAAIDFIEVKSAILRTIESVVQERRALIERERGTLALVQAAAAAADNRLGTLAGPLAEARHDVSVARALRQEEQERVAAINTRRDTLIRDEVRFLAYVRPRAVDPVRRDAPGWKLESADTLAPVPACLQRHDQPPDPLRAYVQLFRHAPARWFTDIAPRLRELDTHEKLIELLRATQHSALLFSGERRVAFASTTIAVAAQQSLQSAFSIVEASRTRATSFQLVRPDLRSWVDFHREVEAHSSLGDVIDGRHGHPALARAAAGVLAQIEEVATCLHAEFAAVPPALRLAWVERYSQFDRPAPLRDLTALPRYGSLDRTARRRFQAFADWLFGRLNTSERDAFNLMNDLVRICLLLASHAPVKALIAGHVPRPVPVRLGTLVPVRAFDPRLVRIGMEVHVWHAEKIVARARVEDLRDDGEVSARIEHTLAGTTMLDQKMRVQFVAAAFRK